TGAGWWTGAGGGRRWRCAPAARPRRSRVLVRGRWHADRGGRDLPGRALGNLEGRLEGVDPQRVLARCELPGQAEGLRVDLGDLDADRGRVALTQDLHADGRLPARHHDAGQLRAAIADHAADV